MLNATWGSRNIRHGRQVNNGVDILKKVMSDQTEQGLAFQPRTIDLYSYPWTHMTTENQYSSYPCFLSTFQKTTISKCKTLVQTLFSPLPHIYIMVISGQLVNLQWLFLNRVHSSQLTQSS